ncbi:hypothetical protein K435DRAFT_869545 [Dendrothele bispora CBS 962.96]|uniref:Uncharacterized protein n=1 Tax=Dendrothele bispora (strain CBS 962.96) TaxID=1314807 RepID=A0A4S8L8Y2_DENBC|nr:hypothetical protein K435DRAFT_869545 [Dendrothele bispora CBS 962.96]
MSSSPFTVAQQCTLKDDYLPDYLALDSDQARNKHLNTIIPQILEHDDFRSKLGSEKTEKEWKASILKYFKNRRQTQRQQQIRKDAGMTSTQNLAHDPVNCIKAMRKAIKLFQVLGHENIDGQGLFKSQNEEKIREHAVTLGGNATANFKKALKELWDAESDKASYESQAREYWNVANNQFQFLVGASRLLSAVCEYQHLGKAELMLMYTFSREDGTCDSGCISGHSKSETTDFADEHEEAYKSFLDIWNKYGEKYCKTLDSSPRQSRFTIPVDSTGRPRFPDLDFEKVTGEELREVMSVYFNALWGFAGRKGQPTYAYIKNTPDSFFDSTRFKLPCFRNPRAQEFTRSMVTQLAEWLCEHSSMSAVQPFEFSSATNHPSNTTLPSAMGETEKQAPSGYAEGVVPHNTQGLPEAENIEQEKNENGKAIGKESDGAMMDMVDCGMTVGGTMMEKGNEEDADGTTMGMVGSGAKETDMELGKEMSNGDAMDTAVDKAGEGPVDMGMGVQVSAEMSASGEATKAPKRGRRQRTEPVFVSGSLRRSIRHNGAKGTQDQETNPTSTIPSKRMNPSKDSQEEDSRKQPKNTRNGKKSKRQA